VKSFFQLEKQIRFIVSGHDCEKYLNNRLSNNIKVLKTFPAFQFSAALSVQGKTEALFGVIKKQPSEYILFCDGGDANQILAVLSRYKVTEKVNFSDITSSSSSYHLSAVERPDDLILSLRKTFGESLIAVSSKRSGNLGLDLIFLDKSNFSESIFTEMGFIKETSEEHEVARIKAAIPSFPIEINPEFLLQEATLTGSYSTNKGCYVGQEVTQKIDSYAKLPFKLMAFNIINPSQEIMLADKVYLDSSLTDKAGQIISVCRDQQNTFGFVRIKSSIAASTIIFSNAGALALKQINDFTAEEYKCF
jgi:folate-binding protein YgfZ